MLQRTLLAASTRVVPLRACAFLRPAPMPKVRANAEHAILPLIALPQACSRETEHGYWDVKVEVEGSFVAVNALLDVTLAEENGVSPVKKRARKGTGKKKAAEEGTDAEEDVRVSRPGPCDLPPPPGGMYVGAHVSMASGMERAIVNAAAIGARAFAMDTRSKRRWDSPPLTPEVAQAFRQACAKFGYSSDHIIPHGSYLINLGSADPEMLAKSYAAFVDELQRCELLGAVQGIKLYNIHPGATCGLCSDEEALDRIAAQINAPHAVTENVVVVLKNNVWLSLRRQGVVQGIKLYNIHPGATCGLCSDEEALDRIAAQINAAHAVTENVVVVLENTAGGGSTLGRTFGQIRRIIDGVKDKSRVGVCLDTCHLFAAGHDVATTRAAYDAVMEDFDAVIGFGYLRAMHVNDSKAAFGSRKDRHENIGRGEIGMGCFEWVMNDSRLQGLPLIMETPVQDKGPVVDYKASLAAGRVFLKPGEQESHVGTDERDIKLLYSLVRS